MFEVVEPNVHIIASTSIDDIGLAAALEDLGAAGWTTDSSSDAETLTEFAGKLCYMSFDTSLNKNLTRTGTRNNADYIQKGLVATRHGSVLEHSTVSFLFTRVSRVLTHELVRHRPGTAYSQLSGRYVRSDCLEFSIPSCLEAHEGAVEKFIELMDNIQRGHKELAELVGIEEMTDFTAKKIMTSALRRVLPNGQANHILFTANHRTLRHVIAERTSPGAEEEIRLVFAKVGAMLKARFPSIYADMEPAPDGIQWTFGVTKV